ncbi:DUF2066 domain-containing protein [Porticoccus sp.]
MKSSLLSKIFALLWAACFSLVVNAASVTNLYEALVPVADQSVAERSRALRVGLGTVLVKVTGNSAVLADPEILQAMAGAKDFVTEYGYVSYSEPGESDANGLALNIHFAETSVDRLMRRKQLQVWPADRPELLVWMVIDSSEGGRQFVSADDQPALMAQLNHAMKQRAAPLLMPLLDLTDRMTLTEEDAWNFNLEKLTEASARYNSHAWMAVRLYQSATGQWRGARLLKLEGSDNLRSLVADSPALLVKQLVGETVDSLASRYAFVPQTSDQELVLNVDHVETYQSFSDVTGYLESLELVRSVIVDYVDGDRLGLRLSMEGEISLLLDTLRRDGRMTEKVASDSSGAAPNGYLFSWGRP